MYFFYLFIAENEIPIINVKPHKLLVIQKLNKTI